MVGDPKAAVTRTPGPDQISLNHQYLASGGGIYWVQLGQSLSSPAVMNDSHDQRLSTHRGWIYLSVVEVLAAARGQLFSQVQ